MSAATRTDRIKAVYDYVCENIEPVQFGGGTTLDTLKNRAGGILDRTVLAQALLDRLGIAAYVTEVYDLGTGKRFPPLPDSGYLGRPHLFIPGDSESGSFPALSHPGDRSVSLASRYASVDETADPKIKEGLRFHLTPHGVLLAPPLSSAPTQGWVERHLEIDISPGKETAGCRGRFHYDGAVRAFLKQAIVDKTYREQIVAAEAARTIQGFLLKSGEFEGVEDSSRNLTIRVEGEVKGFLEPAEKGSRFDPVPDKSNLAGNTREAARVHPLQFDETVVYNPTVTVFRLPYEGEGSDWVFSRVPDDVFLITRFGYYSLDYEVRGNELWVLRSAYVPKQWIEPEDYPEFQDFCRSVDTAEQSRVEIAPWPGLK
jgi:hypothetical protein